MLRCVAIEHELETLLRRRLQRKDQATWERLLEDQGPLRSFHSKIELAYALGTVNEETRKYLNVVRAVRNAFAHSKKLLDFDDPLITDEILSVFLANNIAKDATKAEPKRGPRILFVNICLKILTKLMEKQARAAKAEAKRAAKALARWMRSAPADFQPPKELEEMLRRWLPADQIGDPNPPTLQSKHEKLMRKFSKASDNGDK